MTPLARIDWASWASAAVWKLDRGCRGLGSMASISISIKAVAGWAGAMAAATAAAGVGSSACFCGWVAGSRAERPLPSAFRGGSVFLLMLENFFGEFDIAFGAARSGVVKKDWLPVAGRFRQPDASLNDRIEDLILKKLFEVVRHLLCHFRTIILHGQQDAFDSEVVFEGFTDAFHGID